MARNVSVNKAMDKIDSVIRIGEFQELSSLAKARSEFKAHVKALASKFEVINVEDHWSKPIRFIDPISGETIKIRARATIALPFAYGKHGAMTAHLTCADNAGLSYLAPFTIAVDPDAAAF